MADLKPQPSLQFVQQTANVLGSRPTMTICRSCNSCQMSTVTYKPGTKTHLFAIVLFVTTLCCCCIPYLVDSCMNADHHCSQCGAYLGTYNN